MKSIYIITNYVDDMVYIGCTGKALKRRLREHIGEHTRVRSKNKPLYRAMHEYGANKFKIELIEECEDSDATETEKRWIEYYRRQNKCYNIALGGAGKPLYSHQEIEEKLKRNPYPSIVAAEIGCSRDLARQIAEEHGLTVKNIGQETNVNRKRTIYQYTTAGEYMAEFDSIKNAIDWCVANGICKKQASGARGKISACAMGKRKQVYGYVWRYSKT